MANIKGNRQIRRTREAIQQAYLELLKVSPSNKIKISEICQRANISRPTFYNHFESKDEVLLSYLDEVLEEMFIEYRRIDPDRETEEFINFQSASVQFFKLWQSRAELYDLIIRANAVTLLVGKLIEHHLKTYHVRVIAHYPIDDPEILDIFMSHLSHVFFVVLDQWMKSGMKRTPEEMGELLAILYDPMLIKRLSDRYSSGS